MSKLKWINLSKETNTGSVHRLQTTDGAIIPDSGVLIRETIEYGGSVSVSIRFVWGFTIEDGELVGIASPPQETTKKPKSKKAPAKKK